MNSGNPLIDFLIALAILIVIVLVFREVICWYWKINRMVHLLESIDASLRNRGGTA